MRGVLLALLLIAAGTSGCIGDGGSSIGTSETHNVNRGCSSTGTDGTLRPDEPLAVAGEAGADGAHGTITYEADPQAGTIQLTLERGGTTVWSDTRQGVGWTSFSTGISNLDAGTYTLEASTDDGYSNARLGLTITWGGGTCD